MNNCTPGTWLDIADASDEASGVIRLQTAENGWVDATEEDIRLMMLAPQLLATMRVFLAAAYPVSPSINPRGHNYCEAYLDEALEVARSAVAKLEEEQP